MHNYTQRIILNFLSLLLFAVIGAHSAPAATHIEKFTEITASRHTQIIWQVTPQDNHTTLQVSQAALNYVTTTDESLNVLRCEFTNDHAKTILTAARDKNTLILRGTFRGAPIEKKISIDEAPWYQPLSFSLSKFIKNRNTRITFWTINPDTLKAYKMQASKTGLPEILSISGKKYHAQKVKVNLTGMKGAFWHAYYWFELDTGSYLQYEGVNGPPGTPETRTTREDATP